MSLSVIDMPEISAPVQERVAFGAKTLDEIRPDWFQAINKNVLQMHSGQFCVVGQVFNGCCYSCKLHDQGFESSAAHLGFDVGTGYVTFEGMMKQYAELKDAWIAEIDARLAMAEVTV